MRTFLWYKFKILKNSKFKLACALGIMLILIGIQVVIDIKKELFISFLGLSYTLLLTYVLFTIDDLLRVSYFIALRKKITVLWKSNILYHVCVGYFVSTVSSIIYGLLFEIDVISEIINSLLTIPVAAVFIGLSTIHFRNYTKKEIYFSSVWAIINPLIFLIPLGMSFLGINPTQKFFLLLFIVGTLSYIVLGILMKKQNTELLVMNLKKEIGLYDISILHIDEE